jgi:2-oxoglutarate/2-oxoacid ferredoxin oxidoreductase subunit alpha
MSQIQLESKVNNFSFKIGTVNGTGSASANGMLLQSIFRMGIPVSGKNVFPSNIQGLPTWYEIRVNGDGHIARPPHFDLMVIMNPATYAKDIKEVVSGGYILYDSTKPMNADLLRDDVNFIGVPIGQMCVENFKGIRERILMKNIIYFGALAALFNMDMDVINTLIHEKFSRKPRLVGSNEIAIQLGWSFIKDNFEAVPLQLQSMNENEDCILINGNTAAALGCVYAGATVGAWYPITPSTSLMDGFSHFCEKFRIDPETGQRRFCIVQAEDELSAAGMVLGAGWAGARAFTPTSGPGISLMSELIGLAYYAEIPTVFFDIQRTGPSTGMPTRTQQGDLMLTAFASHGDTKHIVLIPANPEECFYFSVAAFDLAERFQSPVFVLSDLDIGMNDWVIPNLKWDDSFNPDRGKVLSAQELDELDNFYRYLDKDGDGIPARSIPGVHPKGAYFTRGSGHNKYGGYTEDSEEYMEVVDRIARKINSSADFSPQPIVTSKNSKYGIISLGGCDNAIKEAIEKLEAQDLTLDYMRIRAFPFPQSVKEFIQSHELCFVVEQNRDAQLRSLIRLETELPAEKLISILDNRGLPLNCQRVIDGINTHLTGTPS